MPNVPTTNCKLVFGTDGNLCAQTLSGQVSWCTYSHQLDGRYFGLAPAFTTTQIGFYVLNSKGRMVYGRFTSLQERSNLKMIPGSFIVANNQEYYPETEDRIINEGGVLTNGKSYIRLESNGQLAVYDSNPYNAVTPQPIVLWRSDLPAVAPTRPFYAQLESTGIVVVGANVRYLAGKLNVASATAFQMNWMGSTRSDDWGFSFIKDTKIIDGYLSKPGVWSNYQQIENNPLKNFANGYFGVKWDDQTGIIAAKDSQTGEVLWTSPTTNIPQKLCGRYYADFGIYFTPAMPSLCVYSSTVASSCTFLSYWCQKFPLTTYYIQAPSGVPEFIATNIDGRITWTANSIKYLQLTK
ncbi:hypothetical protein PPL_10704 [Heterostelium album PN500]|uniref:Uncharacterized protein n=1 Tax=Heterostelium pallidum (strain ATCC 26659 / Pp 5 / PN500) TaxID=670386 RepID=D3BRU2_HETP5|nr:hypothetical protein PPL_10704 [Heterostelium album PN500]EFA76124.1 hypothetical protein PPL_10704 [Heterostelium album PN500]|eukprot:XP_020428258.1 hypothetical protein PPL_10704 [Heterostelium album PN500]